MFAKLSNSLSGMHARRISDLPAEIVMSSKSKVVFWQREVEHNGQHTSQFCCNAILEFNPKPIVEKVLSGIAVRKLSPDDIPDLVLPYKDMGKEIIDEHRNIAPRWAVPLEALPQEVQRSIADVYKNLSDLIRRSVSTVRWIQRSSGHHQPYGVFGFEMSQDGETWFPAPQKIYATVFQPNPVDTTPASMEALQAVISKSMFEPFPHELIREAGELSTSAPRSALLISVSALETGLKRYLAYLVPNSDIILEKVQSPPALTLLQDVIPAAQSKTEKSSSLDHIPLKKENKQYLEKWISQRNHVAHGLKDKVDQQGLSEFIEFVGDLLYIFDFLSGHEWALQRLCSGRFEQTQHLSEARKTLN